MIDAIRLGLGFGPRKMKPRDPIQHTINDEGTERVVLYEDNTASGVAAHHNKIQIYGRENLSPTDGMRPVIEVKQSDGSWVPVSGSRNMVPDGMTQIAYLQNYRETGQVGVTPVAPDDIVQTNALAGPDSSLLAAASNIASQIVNQDGAGAGQGGQNSGASSAPTQPTWDQGGRVGAPIPQNMPMPMPMMMPFIMGPDGQLAMQGQSDAPQRGKTPGKPQARAFHEADPQVPDTPAPPPNQASYVGIPVSPFTQQSPAAGATRQGGGGAPQFMIQRAPGGLFMF